MPLARLIDATAEHFGWRRVYEQTTQVDVLLAEQAETVYREAPDHVALATAKNDNALALQPGVLDVRSSVLADVLYLECLVAGARARDLSPDLIQRLEDAVDRGHELTVLLAETARATTAIHAVGH